MYKNLTKIGKHALFASVAIALLGSANATEFLDPPKMATPKSITVFVAKKVVTMDPSNPTATAVAVSDGKILSVGSLEDLKPWTDKYPTQINREFADKVIYPGFVDPHEHPLQGGVSSTSYPLTYFPLPSPWAKPFPGVKTLPAAMAKLKEYSASIADPNELMLAWGYDIVGMKQIPNKDLLDQVSTTRPIFVWDSSEHNIFLNSAAINKYINVEEAKKLFGTGVNPDGSLNGQFMGVVTLPFVFKSAAKDLLSQERIAKALLYSNDLAQQAGITTTSELTFGALNIDLETELLQKFTSSNVTSLRIEAIPYYPAFNAKYGDQAIAQVQSLKKLDTDRLYFKGIKWINDDAFLANTMKMGNPGYTDGHEGKIFYPSAEAFAGEMKPWWDAGFQIHVHSNGNEGNVQVLNALQILQDQKPRFDHRFTVEHLGMPSTAAIRKLKVLGAVASVNPSYFYVRAGLSVDGLGTDRESYATRVGALVREGIPVALHSDNPVTPPAPLTQAWSVVNRLGLYTGNKKWAPAEAVSVEEAMKMITINAAYVIGLESKVGSIEPGKYADFTVLAADPVTVPKEKIKDVPVIGTVLGGRYIPVSETKQPRPF